MIIEHDQAINILGSSDKIIVDDWTGLKAYFGEDENDKPCLCSYDEINEEGRLLMTNEQLAKSIFKVENNTISAWIKNGVVEECVFSGRVYLIPSSINEIIG